MCLCMHRWDPSETQEPTKEAYSVTEASTEDRVWAPEYIM